MKRFKLVIGILGVAALFLFITLVLRSEYSLISNPKGLISHKQWELIARNYLLMFIIVIPTFVLLFFVVWKYGFNHKKAKYDPEHSYGKIGAVILWGLPSVIIAVMAVKVWFATHELDPYRPIPSDVVPVKIQVVAIDWKWLFIYPEQGIATLNFIQIPKQKPIQFSLAADGSPMNSFWIPSLSGQIYAMSGMITPLHILAYEEGEYVGRAAEINGEGFADMTFVVKSTSQEDFDKWIQDVKNSPLQLSNEVYEELLKPSIKDPIKLYSSVEDDLFNKIVMKYMEHPHSML